MQIDIPKTDVNIVDAASRGIEGAGAPGGRFEGKPLVEASIRDMLGDVYGKLGEYSTAVAHLRRALELFEDSEIAPEMRDAVRGTLEKRLAAITAAAGPPSPGQGADSDPDE